MSVGILFENQIVKCLAVRHDQIIVFSVHALEPKTRIEVLKDRAVLFDNRFAHHNKE